MEDDEPTPDRTTTGGAAYRDAVRQATDDAAMATIQKEQKDREEKTVRLKEARELVERRKGD